MESPRVSQLVLDAGPLLSLAPLRGLSREYFTVPHVLGELKDEKSRAHFRNLGLSSGVKVETRVPGADALSKGILGIIKLIYVFNIERPVTDAVRHSRPVTLAAKKSGDFAVLSTADLHVIALTYALHEEYTARKLVAEKVNFVSLICCHCTL
jgi:RNA-binding protein NOB1